MLFLGKPGGGRNDVDPRFISLFSVFNQTFPAEESLYQIYNSILRGHVQPFVKEIQELVPHVTRMTMQLYRYSSVVLVVVVVVVVVAVVVLIVIEIRSSLGGDIIRLSNN